MSILPATDAILDRLPGMVYRCRYRPGEVPHGLLLYASAGAETLTGWCADTWLGGRTWSDFIHPADRERVAESVHRAVDAGEGYVCTYRLRTAGEEICWVQDRGRLLEVQGERCLEGFIVDAAEQMKRQQQLEKQVALRTRRLAALYDVTELAHTLTDLQAALLQALDSVLGVTRAVAGVIHLLDAEGVAFYQVAQQGLPAELAQSLTRLPAGTPPLAAVTFQKRTLHIKRVPAERRLGLFHGCGFREYVGVPVPAGEYIRGVLSVFSAQKVRFRAEEVDFLISVGEQMGVLVEQARLRRKAEQLLVMEERNRLARELHDSVTQSLYSVLLFAETGRRMVQSGNQDEAARYLGRVGETGLQALKEMRLLVHKLRPSILAQEGLVPALQNRLRAVEGRAGVSHELLVDGPLDLSAVLEEALFHIAQEALNNALKHALADEVTVRLRQDGEQVFLEVQDNGQGFDPAVTNHGGLGLISMRERAETFGGALTILATPGKGTTIRACLRESPPPGVPDLADIL